VVDGAVAVVGEVDGHIIPYTYMVIMYVHLFMHVSVSVFGSNFSSRALIQVA